MKGIHVFLIAAGTGIVTGLIGFGVGAFGGAVVGATGGAVVGAAGGAATGICATTHVAKESGFLSDQQIEQIGQQLGQLAAQQKPELAKSVAQALQESDSETGNATQADAGNDSESFKTDFPDCDRLLKTIAAQADKS